MENNWKIRVTVDKDKCPYKLPGIGRVFEHSEDICSFSGSKLADLKVCNFETCPCKCDESDVHDNDAEVV